MDVFAAIDILKDEYPFCEYVYGNPAEIPFSDKVFTICQTDCQRYGHCWACPPNAGTIEDNIKRVRSYENYFLFTSIWEVVDAWNVEYTAQVKKEHEALTRQFRQELHERLGLTNEALYGMAHPPVYTLSAGCEICEACACPNEPCRHPADRLMTTESHGIVLMQLLEAKGVCYNYGGNTVVYASMILF